MPADAKKARGLNDPARQPAGRHVLCGEPLVLLVQVLPRPPGQQGVLWQSGGEAECVQVRPLSFASELPPSPLSLCLESDASSKFPTCSLKSSQAWPLGLGPVELELREILQVCVRVVTTPPFRAAPGPGGLTGVLCPVRPPPHAPLPPPPSPTPLRSA